MEVISLSISILNGGDMYARVRVVDQSFLMFNDLRKSIQIWKGGLE